MTITPTDEDIAEARKLAITASRKRNRTGPVEVEDYWLAHAQTIAKLRVALGALEVVKDCGNASMKMLAGETIHQITQETPNAG